MSEDAGATPEPSAAALATWLDHFAKTYAVEGEVRRGGLDIVLPHGVRTMQLGNPPAGSSVAIKIPPDLDAFDFWTGAVAPSEIVIDGSEASSLRKASIGTSLNLESLILKLPRDMTDEFHLHVGNASVLRLEVEGGSLVTQFGCPAIAVLRDTRIRPGTSWSPDALHVAGEVRVEGHPVTCTRLILADAATLHFPQLQWDVVEQAAGADALRFDGGTHTGRCLCFDGVITIAGANLNLVESGPCAATESLTVRGAGVISVRGKVERAVFEPTGELVLALAEHAQALEVTGEVRLQMGQRSVCTGAPGRPLRLRRVDGCAEAELDGVDLYALTLADLASLSALERLSPWIPEKPKDARSREDAMLIGVDPAERGPAAVRLVRDRRAHFWARLSTILTEKHATGRVQSEARYAAMRARRMSLGWRSERFLLEIYNLVGYGERIGYPLYWLLGVALLGAPWFVPTKNPTLHFRYHLLPVAWIKAVASPLAFFRFVDVHVSKMTGASVVTIIVRVVGIVLVFFALNAMRRRAKAE